MPGPRRAFLPGRRRAILFAAVLFLFAGAPRAPAGEGDAERLVAIGDLHGNMGAFVSALEAAELIDDERHWIGGATTLVQTGDILDRGVHFRDILDLLRTLQTEARDAGGDVVVLLGNHEILDLLGVIREVDPASYRTFVDDDSETRREADYADYLVVQRRRARYLGTPRAPEGPDVRKAWMAAHPLGKAEFLEAFGPDGEYGSWMRTWPSAVRIGDTVLVHGGLGPRVRGVDLEEINSRVLGEIETFDRIRALMTDLGLIQATASVHLMDRIASVEAGLAATAASGSSLRVRERMRRARQMEPLADWKSWLLADAEGPLWFFAPNLWDEDDDAELVEELIAGVGARRMVVGHFPQNDGRIRMRFDGRIFLIDTWMEDVPERGSGSALEIAADGSVRARYSDGSELLVPGL